MKRVGVPIVLGLVIGAIVVVGFDFAVETTSTNEFCASCHEIADNAVAEFAFTGHARNASGVRADCADCHLPKPFVPKMQRKLRGLVELYGHFTGVIGTTEKYDLHRMAMATRVWADMNATDSRECRDCHVEAEWDLAAQTEKAAQFHRDALSNGKTCIDCHKGLAHDLPAGIEEDTLIEGIDF